MKDLNKIKAAILVAFGEASKNGNSLKLTKTASKLLRSAQGMVNYHHEKMGGWSFDAFDEYPATPRDLGWDYTRSLEKDFCIDKTNVNKFFNEALIALSEELDESIVLNANEAWGVFYRAYDYAGRISNGGSSYRYDFDKMIYELTQHKAAEISMSITLALLVIDAKVPHSVCVEYYIRRLHRIVKDTDYYLLLEVAARKIMGEEIYAETEEPQAPVMHQSPTITSNKKSTEAPSTCTFTSEAEEEGWTDIIKKFIKDNNITTPLNGRGNNPTLAMVCYFYEKWRKEAGLLVPHKLDTILNFFTQKCGIEKATTDKNICNRISEYLKGDRNFDKIPDIKERVNQVFASYKLKKITTKKISITN